MYSFYIVRGHKLEDLEQLSLFEKIFYIQAMGEYYNDEARKLGASEEDIAASEQDIVEEAKHIL